MKRFLKILLALFGSFICVNMICMFYYSAPGDIYRENGATKSIRMPDSFYINGHEGHSFIHFDKRGYNNIRGELDCSYVLIMGSSHMEATYVSQKQNMSTRLNYLLGGTNDKLRVYNIAHAGNPFPQIVKGFKAGIEEFSHSSAIVIEVYTTSYSVSDLRESLHQIEYHPSSSGEYLKSNLKIRQKFRSWIIGGVPFIKYVIGRQFEAVDFQPENPFGLKNDMIETERTFDKEAYSLALGEAMSLLRGEYDNPIIILYHPEVSFRGSGMEIVRDNDTYDIFENVCRENGIVFLDTGNAFLRAYDERHAVPYGFHNTVIGYGHLNAEGHEIIANELFQVIKGLQEVQ